MKKFVLVGAAAAALLALPSLAQAPQRGSAQSMTLDAMQARAQAQFARTDADRDGFLTQAETQAQGASRPGREQRLAAREQRQAKRAERIARLDTDRDGTISQAERQARAAARGGDQAQREARQAQRQARQAQRLERRAQRQATRGTRGLRMNEQRFARLDANKDSRLSLAEVTARLAARFQRLDADRDGAVTREERRSARAQRQSRRNG